MGGTPTYLIPAAYTGMSSYDAHRNRGTPSSEPGTDYYMPTGTPLGAPARCRVVEIGGSIYDATGRYVTVDDGTRWLRFLHLSKWRCSVGDELDPGEIFADSGASGYGSELFGESSRNDAFWNNTGGDHVHVTAFARRGYPAYWNGSGTVDFHALTGGKIAGNREDDMSAEADAQIRAVYGAVFGAPNIGAKQVTWKKPSGPAGVANYGIFDCIIALQGVAAKSAGELAAIKAAVSQLSVGSGVALDMKVIEAAAERGAKEALSGLVLTADVD